MSLSSLLDEESPELLKLRVLKQEAELSFLKRELEGEPALFLPGPYARL